MQCDFLEMPYELNIKMKCVAPLLLGDVNNFLIPPPPRTLQWQNCVVLVKTWQFCEFSLREKSENTQSYLFGCISAPVSE